MKVPLINEETIKGYLLGQIPEEEGSQVEARLLTDREFYEELSIVEDELIDQYLEEALSAADRERFESHFISSSERQQKVRFARALRKYVSVADEQSQESTVGDESLHDSSEMESHVSLTPSSLVTGVAFRRPVISYAIAAAILIAVGVSCLALVWYWPFRTSSGKVLAVELSSAPATRDVSAVREINLTPDIASVRLQLDLPKNEYQSYEAVLRDSSLRTVLSAKDLKPQIINGFAALTMDLKADVLSPGDYRIHLSGTTADDHSDSLATFSFTVRTK